MARTEIRFDDYKVKAFLDANIILEGRPLADLPWREIDADGPIIALMTPTAMNEVDSKKQDGRLGKRAREFNRLIGSVAAGGPPIVIRDGGPRVELALSRASKIPWDQLDGLDPQDGDSCIVAEALHARDMNAQGKVVVSHDIKSIRLAADHDMNTLHVSDDWLRAPEPSPHDKEVQKLKNKVAEYEAKEPAFEISIEILDGEPVSVVRIEELTDAERNGIEQKILADNPKQDQVRSKLGMLSALGNYDSSYDGRFATYLRRIPEFMANYEQRVERLFNQARFRISVANVGKMQAENLLIEVNVSSGWLHSRYVYVSPGGPTAPTPRTISPLMVPGLHNIPTIPRRAGRHEFAFKDEPRWRSFFSVTCEDFRNTEDWAYEGIVGIDPRAPDTKIIVTVTASNFRGRAQEVKLIKRNQETVHIAKLVDQDSFKPLVSTPIDKVMERQSYEDKIDWSAFAADDDDDE